MPCRGHTPEETVSIAESVETETVETQTPEGTVEETDTIATESVEVEKADGTVEEQTEVVEEIVTDPDFMVGPFGSLMLMDGTTYEIAELEKDIQILRIHYRQTQWPRLPTVISLTRLKDPQALEPDRISRSFQLQDIHQ